MLPPAVVGHRKKKRGRRAHPCVPVPPRPDHTATRGPTQTPKVGRIYRLGRRISGRDGSEPVSKVPVVHHRQPGTAFANRKEPFSLGGSDR